MATFCIVGALLYWVLEARAEARYSLGEGHTDKVVWRDLFRFGVSYWFVVALCITFYSAIFPFQTFAVKFFIEAHGTSREFGGFLSSLLTLFAMICTPLFGLLVDKVGKRSLFMMFGALLLMPVYLLMAYQLLPLGVPVAVHLRGQHHPVAPAVLQGFAGDLLACSTAVDVGRVQEVDTRVQSAVHHPDAFRLVRLAAEHHASQTELADFDACAPQRSVFHRSHPP